MAGRLATASLERTEDLDEKMSALVDSHIRLADSQARTDERLNVFINVVERYISKDNNGRSQNRKEE